MPWYGWIMLIVVSLSLIQPLMGLCFTGKTKEEWSFTLNNLFFWGGALIILLCHWYVNLFSTIEIVYPLVVIIFLLIAGYRLFKKWNDKVTSKANRKILVESTNKKMADAVRDNILICEGEEFDNKIQEAIEIEDKEESSYFVDFWDFWINVLIIISSVYFIAIKAVGLP